MSKKKLSKVIILGDSAYLFRTDSQSGENFIIELVRGSKIC